MGIALPCATSKCSYTSEKGEIVRSNINDDILIRYIIDLIHINININ